MHNRDVWIANSISNVIDVMVMAAKRAYGAGCSPTCPIYERNQIGKTSHHSTWRYVHDSLQMSDKKERRAIDYARHWYKIPPSPTGVCDKRDPRDSDGQ